MFSSRILFGILPFALLVCGTVYSQQYSYHIVSITPDDDGSEQMKAILDGENESVVARLNSWIVDMDRTCELSEEQMRKLRVVVKGSAKKRYDVRKKELDQQAKQFAGRNQTMSFAVMPKSPRDIDSQKMWVSTLKKILNDQQQEKYNAWLEMRKEFQRKSLVNNMVAELDQSLFLSEGQRESLIEIIDSNFGEKLVKQANKVVNNQMGGRRMVGAPEPQFVELVKDVLNETQLEEWKRTVEAKLQALN